MKRALPLAPLFALVLFGACDSGSGGLIGNWEPVDPAASEITLSFSADSTFQMDTGQFVGEGSYRMEGGTNLVLEPTGSLGVVVPAGFTGELFGNTLNLCNPGGLCNDYQKVR